MKIQEDCIYEHSEDKILEKTAGNTYKERSENSEKNTRDRKRPQIKLSNHQIKEKTPRNIF